MDLRNVGILPQHYTASQPRRWRQHGPPKRWYPTTTLHGVTIQKTWTCTNIVILKLCPFGMKCHSFTFAFSLLQVSVHTGDFAGVVTTKPRMAGKFLHPYFG